MQADTQRYLDFLENSGNFLFVDSETGGLEGDYGKLYVVTAKPFGKAPVSFTIGENACDRGLARDAKEYIDSADAIVTFYGKGFDVPMINTRLTRWGYHPLNPVHHIDMFFVLKHKLKTQRKSQAHLLEFLEDTMELLGIKPERKMSISPNVWADLWSKYSKNIKILKERCESDTEGLEALYKVTRHLIRDIKKG